MAVENLTMANMASLGLDLELQDGDIVTDAILIARISRGDGSSYVGVDTSSGTDLIVEGGLLEFAREAHRRQTWGND